MFIVIPIWTYTIRRFILTTVTIRVPAKFASFYDDRSVKVFDARRGTYLSTFGDMKSVVGQSVDAMTDATLHQPHGLCCDSRGNVIVCDTGNRRVVMFSHDGRFLTNLLLPPGGTTAGRRTGRGTKGVLKACPIDVDISQSGDRLALTLHEQNSSFRKLVVYDFDQS